MRRGVHRQTRDDSREKAISMTKTKQKSRRAAYHERQVESGKVLVQTYLDRELRERLDLIARKRGEPLHLIFDEMVEDYCDREEKFEADALRALFAAESPVPAVAS